MDKPSVKRITARAPAHATACEKLTPNTSCPHCENVYVLQMTASPSEGIFSKHGGKMVLGFIGVIGLWFLRSHLGGKNLDAVKDEVNERRNCILFERNRCSTT